MATGIAAEAGRGAKAPDAFRTISEVADDLDVPQHVLRFWETRFPQIKPLKRGGGRRYYRREDVELVAGIRALLYGQGYTIKGVQRILREGGVRNVQAVGRGEAPAFEAPEPPAPEPAAIPEPAWDAGEADEGTFDDGRAVLEAALAELRECRRVLAALRPEAPDAEIERGA